MNSFRFEQVSKDPHSNARLGVIHTPHGIIETPAFIPVGTQATVKSLTPDEIADVGTQMFFVNTYHMAMRPGIELVKEMGGIHEFMRWNGPVITDSGGFQVFSLARRSFSEGGIARQHVPRSQGEGGSVGERGSAVGEARHQPLESSQYENQELSQAAVEKVSQRGRKNDGDSGSSAELVTITEEGVTFRSHWDGAYHLFTPEISMAYQWDLGSDIHIAFDDCTPYPVTHESAKLSMERTHRWAVRSLNEHKNRAKTQGPYGRYQALYGSIQGSVYEDLRTASASFIAGLDTDGIAIGGVSVGESKAEMSNVLHWVLPLLPDEKPRHLLGVGEIDDIFNAVKMGVDTFDCVQASRVARMGYVYTKAAWKMAISTKGLIDINKKVYQRDSQPIDSDCTCYTCKTFTRAYVHHLFRVRELLGYRLATIHNLHFLHSLVSRIRQAIADGTLLELEHEWLIP